MKAILFSTAFLLTSFLACGQNFEESFKDLASKEDTIAQIKLLKEWEAANPQDPELFISYFNYYTQKGMKEILAMDNSIKRDEDGLEITDPATGKSVGYIHSSIKYNLKNIQKGIDYINKGISKYPARLDMRFGKIYMLGKLKTTRNLPKI